MKTIFQLVIVQLLSLLIDCQRTSTYTEWRTISSTEHFTSNFVCAKLVNVTRRCRQRRGFPMEQPIILIMDGPLYMDANEFHNLHSQFTPTQTLRIENTPLTVSPDWPMDYSLQSPTNIEASVPRISSRGKQLSYFSKITNAVFNPIVPINVTITKVLTHTLSRTTTKTTNFFLMGCIPSPLPYTTCPASSTEMGSELVEDEERKLFQFHRWKNKKTKDPIIHTVTRTSTVTTLITASTVGLCARLVNVTGPCRLHRGFRMEDPVILSFDDDMDSIDSILSPSKTFSIEPTVGPIEGPTSGRWVHDGAGRLFVSDPAIRSSAPPEELEEADKQKLGFHNVFGWKLALKKRIKFVTLITTVFVTTTSTSLDYVTVSTKTFFVQICTPSPFPFDVCVRTRR